MDRQLVFYLILLVTIKAMKPLLPLDSKLPLMIPKAIFVPLPWFLLVLKMHRMHSVSFATSQGRSNKCHQLIVPYRLEVFAPIMRFDKVHRLIFRLVLYVYIRQSLAISHLTPLHMHLSGMYIFVYQKAHIFVLLRAI